MRLDPEALFDLLPAIYRIRDVETARRLPNLLTAVEQAELGTLRDLQAAQALTAEQAQRLGALEAKSRCGPLKALLTVIAEQVAAIEEDLDQLYDDQFIETCAEWVIPYIGDLIGYRPVRGVSPRLGAARAEVADTIGLRRRKGTAGMLEQAARDVTSLDANVVEYYERLLTTQHLNHVRPTVVSADLRRWRAIEFLGGPFDRVARTAEVGRVDTGRGRYNIPNIGIFLWRLKNRPLNESPAFRVDRRRFLFHPLGIDTPLFNLPVTEETISHLATPDNVPLPLTRRVLAADLERHYGPSQALLVRIGRREVPLSEVHVCNLADLGPDPNTSGWANMPATGVAIDPERGRVAMATPVRAGTEVRVSWRYGFGGDIAGGGYDRSDTLQSDLDAVAEVPGTHPTLEAALSDPNLAGQGAIEAVDSSRHAVAAPIVGAADGRLEVRAQSGDRPIIELSAPLQIGGGDGAEVTLNGFLIVGSGLVVPATVNGQPNRLQILRLRHCTLVPGHALDRAGAPVAAGAPSVVVETDNTQVEIEECIVGPIHVARGARARIRNTIIDANAVTGEAYRAPGGGIGGPLWIYNATVVGEVHTSLLGLASNCIFLGPVTSDQRQRGCVRFSYLPLGSRTPRRYACLPKEGDAPASYRPRFRTLRYGDPEYGLLAPECTPEIRRGAADESEMGAFHDGYEAPRETNLRVRLDEYLRLGLEAGIFYTTGITN